MKEFALGAMPVVGALGMLVACIGMLSVGEGRLLQLTIEAEQKIINVFPGLIVAMASGAALSAVAAALEGSWLMMGLSVFVGVMSTLSMITEAPLLQDSLNLRKADSAGFYLCHECAEVHHLGDDHNTEHEEGK